MEREKNANVFHDLRVEAIEADEEAQNGVRRGAREPGRDNVRQDKLELGQAMPDELTGLAGGW